MWQWREDWQKLLPRLEEVLVEIARLQSIQQREELALAGIMRTVPGIPVDLTPLGKPTTADDVKRVISFQMPLFEGEKPDGVAPSSLQH
jgi:hypothetical protein